MNVIIPRRWVPCALMLITCGVFALVLTISSPTEPVKIVAAEPAKAPAAAPPAGTWPMFGGTPGRNLANTIDKNIPDTWDITKAKAGNIKWSIPLGSITYGGPVISGGRIFVGTNNEKPRDPKITGDKGIVMCFDEATGNFLWQAVHDKLPNPDVNDTKDHGVASSPVVEGDRLYYVSNRAEMVCATTAGKDGKADIVWTYDMIKELNVFPCYLANSSPLVVGDLVFALTSNGVNPNTNLLPSPMAPALVAINKKTGKLAWSDASPNKDIMEGQWSSPCALQVGGVWQVVYGGGDGWLRSFEASSGKLLWKFDLNPKASTFKPGGQGDRSYVVGVPVAVDGKIYIAVGQDPDAGDSDGHLWCIDAAKKPANKELDLTPPDQSFDPKAAGNKDSGLVWHYGGVVLPKPKPGQGREVHFGRTVSTVAIHDGLVYAVDKAGFLKCLDAANGQLQWDEDLKSATWSSPFYVDGKIFMGCDSSDMFIFKAGRKKEQLAKIDMDQILKTPPIAANGVLYITNGATLFAISPGGK